MPKWLIFIIVVVAWTIGEFVWHKLIGFKRPESGLQRYTYDLPAYVVGYIAAHIF